MLPIQILLTAFVGLWISATGLEPLPLPRANPTADPLVGALSPPGLGACTRNTHIPRRLPLACRNSFLDNQAGVPTSQLPPNLLTCISIQYAPRVSCRRNSNPIQPARPKTTLMLGALLIIAVT